ncbi:hypothetical protein [Nonomuraea sp. NPDC003709]|uniref:hypothetical protein n=1 Tax=Nonomuraea sp. NPDC003709 TaxID=3154450 RepID=UPI00339EEB88
MGRTFSTPSCAVVFGHPGVVASGGTDDTPPAALPATVPLEGVTDAVELSCATGHGLTCTLESPARVGSSKSLTIVSAWPSIMACE